MKILVASGSFKDVYNPVEACQVIAAAVENGKNDITELPICDGGEYTYEVLQTFFHYDERIMKGILNAYGNPIEARYLVRGDEAHIVSSEIIRLYPEEDAFKNPLQLTDYGLGQMVARVIKEGYKKIKLYLGGTSTVCCGIGFAQALGANIYSYTDEIISTPVLGKDLAFIRKIDCSNILKFNGEISVIADGNAKSYEMSSITELKIGKRFSDNKRKIVELTNEGIRNIEKITGISPEKNFSGAAGGLLFGIDKCFTPEYKLGGYYFAKLLGLEEKIQDADLVITGEGRFDNTACGKTPATVAALAKKNKTPLWFVCGQIAENSVKNYAGGILDGENEINLKNIGIRKLFTCQEYYDDHPLEGNYKDQIEIFRSKTPELLKELFARETM